MVEGIKVVTELPIQDFPAVFANHFFRKTLPLVVFLRACTFPTFSDFGSEPLHLVRGDKWLKNLFIFNQFGDRKVIQN